MPVTGKRYKIYLFLNVYVSIRRRQRRRVPVARSVLWSRPESAPRHSSDQWLPLSGHTTVNSAARWSACNACADHPPHMHLCIPLNRQQPSRSICKVNHCTMCTCGTTILLYPKLSCICYRGIIEFHCIFAGFWRFLKGNIL